MVFSLWVHVTFERKTRVQYVYVLPEVLHGDFVSEIKYWVNLEWNILQILTRNVIFFYSYSNSLFRGDVTSSNNNESAIFRRWKSNLKWRMFHRLNDKGDNSLTEIPGCPEKRIEVNSHSTFSSFSCKQTKTHVLLLKWSLKSHVTSKREYHNDKMAERSRRDQLISRHLLW